jgi:hypothetical protein
MRGAETVPHVMLSPKATNRVTPRAVPGTAGESAGAVTAGDGGLTVTTPLDGVGLVGEAPQPDSHAIATHASRRGPLKTARVRG